MTRAVPLLLGEILEAMKGIPEEVRTRHSAVPWREVAGARDILIHEYFPSTSVSPGKWYGAICPPLACRFVTSCEPKASRSAGHSNPRPPQKRSPLDGLTTARCKGTYSSPCRRYTTF